MYMCKIQKTNEQEKRNRVTLRDFCCRISNAVLNEVWKVRRIIFLELLTGFDLHRRAENGADGIGRFASVGCVVHVAAKILKAERDEHETSVVSIVN